MESHGTYQKNTDSVLDFLFSFTISSLVKFSVWIVLYYFAIQIEFGVVYFVLSCFVFIFASMSNESEKSGDRVSAYSVFNKGGQEILGNFSTKELEKSFGLPKYQDKNE